VTKHEESSPRKLADAGWRAVLATHPCTMISDVTAGVSEIAFWHAHDSVVQILMPAPSMSHTPHTQNRSSHGGSNLDARAKCTDDES